MRPPRKPSVIALKSTGKQDQITQRELNICASLQAAAWAADRAVYKAVERIRARIFQGAPIEEGPLVFDGDLKMVRTRKTG